MKRRIIIVLILMILSIIGGSCYAVFFHKELNIKSYEKEVRVLVNTEYKDKEIDICYGSIVNCKKLKYKTIGNVDTKVLGDYVLTYVYTAGNKESFIKRTVHVYDDIKPEIVNDSDIIICNDDRVVSKNYHANDNYDGDLTEKIEFNKEEDKYYLTVSDSSSNIEKVEVTPKKYEGEPTLTLNGGSVTIIKGNKYNESGYSASDKCDGDLKDKVSVSGSVDTSKTGTYTLTYKVTNSIGKSVTKKRTVKVINKSTYSYNVPASGKKIIYLTFDDGPGAYTSKLLNILDKYNVKATFFVTNQFGSSTYQKLIAREARSGHSVCIHSYTHQFSIYKSVDTYFNDLNKMNNLIEKQTGKKSKCVRFPGGSSNTVSRKYKKGIMTTLANELGSRGYRYYDWNLDSGDTNVAKSANAVASRVKKNLKGGTYNILMHDIKSYTVNAIEEIIKYGLANGYTFLPITDGSPTFHQRINN